jgi:hypothetical protein
MAQASTFADSPRWRGEWSGPGRAAGGTGGGGVRCSIGPSHASIRVIAGCGRSRSGKTHVGTCARTAAPDGRAAQHPQHPESPALLGLRFAPPILLRAPGPAPLASSDHPPKCQTAPDELSGAAGVGRAAPWGVAGLCCG